MMPSDGTRLPRTNFVMNELYVPIKSTDPDSRVHLRGDVPPGNGADAGLPLPPPELTMAYWRGDPEEYLEVGRRTADIVRSLLAERGAGIGPGDTILDWGCATGRVLRHFAPEARNAKFWGVDIDEAHIEWARRHLPPMFRFATCGAYPHLPFEDRTFSAIYGLSVMTHLDPLRDHWLLELRRVLRPGGYLLLTVCDEATLAGFRETGCPEWLPGDVDVHGLTLGRHEMIVLRGQQWGATHVFYTGEYLRRTWGAYFDEMTVLSNCVYGQAMAVLRKA